MVSFGAKLIGFNAALSGLRAIRTGYSGDARWIVGVGAEYGAYVEFGTSRMAAQPYLFPAARQVVRTRLSAILKASAVARDPLEFIVSEVALAIERLAKRYAPVDTGFLRSSIEAAPAGAFV